MSTLRRPQKRLHARIRFFSFMSTFTFTIVVFSESLVLCIQRDFRRLRRQHVSDYSIGRSLGQSFLGPVGDIQRPTGTHKAAPTGQVFDHRFQNPDVDPDTDSELNEWGDMSYDPRRTRTTGDDMSLVRLSVPNSVRAIQSL